MINKPHCDMTISDINQLIKCGIFDVPSLEATPRNIVWVLPLSGGSGWPQPAYLPAGLVAFLMT